MTKPLMRKIPVIDADPEIQIMGQLAFIIEQGIESGDIKSLHAQYRIMRWLNSKYGEQR